MMIIGCDYHPGFQQIAFVDTETGELQERRLEHREEAEEFYRNLAAQGVSVRLGMEASGHARWFERIPPETGILIPSDFANKESSLRECCGFRWLFPGSRFPSVRWPVVCN